MVSILTLVAITFIKALIKLKNKTNTMIYLKRLRNINVNKQKLSKILQHSYKVG